MKPYLIKINGILYDNPTRQQLTELGLPESDTDRVMTKMERYFEQSVCYERRWRNDELTLTDKLLLADATYGGQLVQNSTLFSDIMEYRKALREYDLKYQPRPERPEWFNG